MFLIALVWADAVYHVGLQNKIGQPGRLHETMFGAGSLLSWVHASHNYCFGVPAVCQFKLNEMSVLRYALYIDRFGLSCGCHWLSCVQNCDLAFDLSSSGATWCWRREQTQAWTHTCNVDRDNTLGLSMAKFGHVRRRGHHQQRQQFELTSYSVSSRAK